MSAVRRSQARSKKDAQAGFTLVELMIGMVIGSLLIAAVFALNTRMSSAFNSQSQIAQVSQTLTAARDRIVRDVRMAGLEMANGLKVEADVSTADTYEVDVNATYSALVVVNDADGTGPDIIRITYGDAGASIRAVPDASTPGTQFGNTFIDTVEDADDLFTIGELIIISYKNPTDPTQNAACLVKVTNTNNNKVIFTNAGAPYNTPQNNHCDDLRGKEPITIFRGRNVAYRIDPNRRSAGVLQVSNSGGLSNDWEDLAIGITNLQVATRYYEKDDTDDLDGDGDPERDWYSGEAQEADDPTDVRPTDGNGDPIGVPIEVTISIEARTRDEVNVAGTSATPAFGDATNITNNNVGDWVETSNCVVDPCGYQLAGVPDASRLERYRGNHVYRWSTLRIDLRNMGIAIPSSPGT